MTDVIALNIDGATHVGARAVVHPGLQALEGQLMMHRIVAICGDYMTLSDGHVYCARTGGPKGYYGNPSLTHRVALTEGSPMFDAWAAQALDPESKFDLPHRTGSTAVAARRPRMLRRVISIG
jgi:hypothetical protein